MSGADFQPYVAVPKPALDDFKQTFADLNSTDAAAADDDDDCEGSPMDAEGSNSGASVREASLDFEEYSLDIFKHMKENEVTRFMVQVFCS